MITLYILATLWLPVVFYLAYLDTIDGVTGTYGLSNKTWNRLNIETVSIFKSRYDAIKVEFTRNKEQYTYIAHSDQFVWPLHREEEHEWIAKAVLKTSLNGIYAETNCTDILKEHAGPSEDFFNVEYDFAWVFPSLAQDAYDTCELLIWDFQNVEHVINLKTNEETSVARLEGRGIKVACREMRDFLHVNL